MAINLQILQAALIGYQIERDRITRAMAGLEAQLKGGKAPASSGPSRATAAEKPKRRMSAAARKRIAAAQKKRWAAYHKSQKAQA